MKTRLNSPIFSLFASECCKYNFKWQLNSNLTMFAFHENFPS